MRRAASTGFLFYLLLLGACAPSAPSESKAPGSIPVASSGGDGAGFNGPTFVTDAVPTELDRGVTVGELKRAMRVCLVAGDRERGLVSLFQNWRFRKTGLLPDLSAAEIAFEVSNAKWDRGALTGGRLLPTATVRLGGESYRLSLVSDETRARLAVDVTRADGSTERDVSADVTPVLGYLVEKTRLEGTPEYGAGMSDDRIVKGLRLVVPSGLKSHGQLAHLLDSDANVADYADCLRAEIHERGASGAPAQAGAADCPELESWRRAKAQRFGPEYDERRFAAMQVLAAYQEGRFDSRRLEACLAGEPDRANFLHTLAAEFFDDALAGISALRGPHGRAFARLYADEFGERELPVFRLTGHVSDESSPTALAGGYHRGATSFHVDLGRVKPADFKVVFLHELAHLLDHVAWEAVTRYSLDRTRLDTYRGWAASGHARLRDLTEGQEQGVRAWVRAGLDRGLFAEYRAWAVTFAIYSEAPWARVSWMDAVDSSSEASLFRLLDAKAIEPAAANGYEIAFVREAYESARAAYRGAKEVPGVGEEFARVLHP